MDNLTLKPHPPILFHHVRRTGGSWMRDMLIQHHKLDLQWVYSKEHLLAAARRIVANDWPDVFYGHWVREIAHFVKALQPSWVEVAFYRNPDEIVKSDWLKCRSREDDSFYGPAMAAQTPEEFGRLPFRSNPIQIDTGRRVPQKWYSFHEMELSYRRFCADFQMEPLESVLANLVQAPPRPEPYPGLNDSDFEFLRKHNLPLPY